jgi:adenylosuccinate synthase
MCVIGNGVVVHLPGLFGEIDALEAAGVPCAGRLLVSDRAHLLFDLHKEVDGAREAELSGSAIGTTRRGIGPAYASKATRNGLRVCDLLRPESHWGPRLRALAADAKARFPALSYDVEAEVALYRRLSARLAPMVADTVHYVHSAHAAGKRILVEGANATLLDLDFGTYPFVTSSNPSMGGVISGLGLAPRHFGAILGVAKAYTTRVGAGPYPTELLGPLGDEVRAKGAEYGTTTGRPRRCGWLDAVALRFACAVNGFDALNVTKLDVLSGLPTLRIGVAYSLEGVPLPSFPADIDALARVEVTYEELPGWTEDISAARSWEELPAAARHYIVRMEALVGVECRYIGVGPGRDAIIIKPRGAV